MSLTSSSIEQDLHTNTSKYVVWEYTPPMDVLQERSLVLYHIAVISWNMQLLQEFLSTVIHIKLLSSTEPIMFGLMNIIVISQQKRAQSRLFTPSKIPWKSYSSFTPPQLDSMCAWSYIHYVLWYKNSHIWNWVTSLWKESWFWFTGWWILYNPVYHWYNFKFTSLSSNHNQG